MEETIAVQLRHPAMQERQFGDDGDDGDGDDSDDGDHMRLRCSLVYPF